MEPEQKVGRTWSMLFEENKLAKRGDLMSVQLLYECFNKFSTASGLVANQNKSCMYFGGVPMATQQEIIQMTGFTTCELPFRYIGVPLI